MSHLLFGVLLKKGNNLLFTQISLKNGSLNHHKYLKSDFEM